MKRRKQNKTKNFPTTKQIIW